MTNSAMGGGGILKRDKKGRVRSTAARRLEVLEQLERSGLSGPEFARVAGMPYQTLASWRQKHKRKSLALRSATAQAEVRPRPRIRLMEVVTADQPALSVGLKIDLPGGASLLVPACWCQPVGASLLVRDVAQAALAARLLKTLATASSC